MFASLAFALLASVSSATTFAAEPVDLTLPKPPECISPVVRRCPPPAEPAKVPPAKPDARSALERERQAQQQLAPVIIYGERPQPKTLQQVFDANLKPRVRPTGATRDFTTADGRRCSQIEGLGYAECTPSADAPPATGFSSAFPAGKP